MTYTRLLRATVGAAFMAASVLVTGQGVQAAPSEITIALSGDFPSLDPSKDTSPIALNYRLNVFDALTEIDQNGAVMPDLATEWTHSDDLLQWTFTLRKGVKFHDGSDFTSDDVVFTVNHIMADNKTPVRNFLKLIAGVEAIDSHTVKFSLKQPYAIFDRQIKYTYIMSHAYWDAHGDEGYATAPVGTGPYRLVEWIKDDRMVLEAFDGYWGGELAVKKAMFRPIPSDAGRANALIAGEVDIVPSLPPSLMDMLAASPDLKIEVAPGFRVAYLGLDPTTKPFDDPKLREAADVAIDREAIANQLMRGTGKASGIIIPPSNEGYDPSFKPVKYDPERAKALVKEAGYDGTPIIMDYPNNNYPQANEIAQALAGYLTEAGFNIELKSMEFTAFFPLWVQRKLSNAHFFAFGSSQFHAETILASMFEEGSHNYRALPEMDKVIKAQREEPDRAKQQKLISEAFRLGNEDRQFVPLWDMLQVYGVKKSIDYDPYPDGVVRLYTFK